MNLVSWKTLLFPPTTLVIFPTPRPETIPIAAIIRQVVRYSSVPSTFDPQLLSIPTTFDQQLPSGPEFHAPCFHILVSPQHFTSLYRFHMILLLYVSHDFTSVDYCYNPAIKRDRSNPADLSFPHSYQLPHRTPSYEALQAEPRTQNTTRPSKRLHRVRLVSTRQLHSQSEPWCHDLIQYVCSYIYLGLLSSSGDP